MKVAFVYPPMLLAGRPLDFGRIDDDERGTTGSEIQILSMAREFAARGHQTVLYIQKANAEEWRGVEVRSYNRFTGEPHRYDAVCVSLDCGVLRCVPSRVTRVCFQQVNGFEYARPGFEKYVDIFVSPSGNHCRFVQPFTPHSAAKWRVIPNGCYPDEYPAIKKISGRCIYASSPCRGLHNVLAAWPAIRAAVPYAELRIFYYSLGKWLSEWSRDFDPAWHDYDKEHWRRANFVAKALETLKDHGVTVMGSVSRAQMAHEMAEAEVLAYPCDTISYTEGFSCATLEGCASGAIPVIAACDALGEIYGGACPMVHAPADKHLQDWQDLVIRALKDVEWAALWRGRARVLAQRHAWPILATKLESEIAAHRASATTAVAAHA